MLLKEGRLFNGALVGLIVQVSAGHTSQAPQGCYACHGCTSPHGTVSRRAVPVDKSLRGVPHGQRAAFTETGSPANS